MTSRPFLVGSVDGGKLEFEVVPLQCRGGLGIVRRLEVIGVGLYEMNVVFDSRDAFLDWIRLDEYRHRAPGLMAFHHHLRPWLPYFRLGGFANSPRLPASYPVMLLMAMVPPLFKRTMRRRLDAWVAAEGASQPQAERPCANLGEFFRT